MSQTTPVLSLPLMLPSQAQKHVTHNEALRRLDAIVQLSVLSRGPTPPAAPRAGDRHIVGGAAVDAWAGQEGKVAFWDGEAWDFIAPGTGWRAYVGAEKTEATWTGTAWQSQTERELRTA